jgi:hypothetical protein
MISKWKGTSLPGINRKLLRLKSISSADMSRRRGTSRVEYCIVQSCTHITIACPWSDLSRSGPAGAVTLTARPRSTLHLVSVSSLPPARRARSRYHPAPSRNEVAIVQPVLFEQLENDILKAIAFLPRWLLTRTKVGHVKMWIRS